jgi:hypothetical protein
MLWTVFCALAVGCWASATVVRHALGCRSPDTFAMTAQPSACPSEYRARADGPVLVLRHRSVNFACGRGPGPGRWFVDQIQVATLARTRLGAMPSTGP